MTSLKETAKQFTQFGLPSNEARVLAALFHYGDAAVSDISRKSGIKRTSVYQYIDSLLKKGLIERSVVGKRTHYSAKDPRFVKKYLQETKRAAEHALEMFDTIVPELASLRTQAKHHPNISFYEGKKHIREAYERIFDTWQDVYAIFTPRYFFNMFSYDENAEMLAAFSKRDVTLFNLVESSHKAYERLEKKELDSFAKSKVLPEDMRFSSDMLVAHDKLALISFENHLAVVIEEESMAQMQQTFLKFIWDRI